MAQPTVRVRLGFTPNTFTLDDLVRGVLDVGQLGGAVTLTDVTADVQNIAISRGRSKDLDSFFTGSCAIKLLNNSRKYENTNTVALIIRVLSLLSLCTSTLLRTEDLHTKIYL